MLRRNCEKAGKRPVRKLAMNFSGGFLVRIHVAARASSKRDARLAIANLYHTSELDKHVGFRTCRNCVPMNTDVTVPAAAAGATHMGVAGLVSFRLHRSSETNSLIVSSDLIPNLVSAKSYLTGSAGAIRRKASVISRAIFMFADLR
jgi:hypothetical protein